MGVESVTLVEARRTADYQTTVYDCVNSLLERFAENQEKNEICADDKQQQVRVNFLITYVQDDPKATPLCFIDLPS